MHIKDYYNVIVFQLRRKIVPSAVGANEQKLRWKPACRAVQAKKPNSHIGDVLCCGDGHSPGRFFPRFLHTRTFPPPQSQTSSQQQRLPSAPSSGRPSLYAGVSSSCARRRGARFRSWDWFRRTVITRVCDSSAGWSTTWPSSLSPTSPTACKCCTAAFPTERRQTSYRCSWRILTQHTSTGERVACRDRLQQLTTTTAEPLFHASRCVRCRRCSRCPRGTYMSPRWTATTGRITSAKPPAKRLKKLTQTLQRQAPAAHHLHTSRWTEVCGGHTACDRAHRALRITVTVTMTHFFINFYTSAVHNIAFLFF